MKSKSLHITHLPSAVLLLGLLPGCSLLPSRLTECSNLRPCPSGQRCSQSTSTCVPVETSSAGDDLGAMMNLDLTMSMRNDQTPSSGPPGMVLVPGGTFMMGTDDWTAFEQPIHAQTVDSFYLDVTEVTVSAYAECLASRECADQPATLADCNWQVPGREHHPVNCVRWEQANEYCQAYGKRLPSEIEFEYAMRGRENSKYAWGNDPPVDQLCWSRAFTCPVDSFPRTLFGKPDSDNGVADLAANLREWTSSLQCGYPLIKNGGVSCNPANRVNRGTAWFATVAITLNAAIRGTAGTDVKSPYIGFRCAWP